MLLIGCSDRMFLLQQLRKVERDKKTMDQEIVDLTNKLLDAKNTIDHLEELNVSLHRPPMLTAAQVRWIFLTPVLCCCVQERYRQDCNLAVQLLKCNKSHFRNHKFADVSVCAYWLCYSRDLTVMTVTNTVRACVRVCACHSFPTSCKTC